MAPLTIPPRPVLPADGPYRPDGFVPGGRPPTAADLRAAMHAVGADSELRPLLLWAATTIDQAATTIDQLEDQRHGLEMSVAELQAQFPSEHDAPAVNRAVTEAVTEWLDGVDAATLERLAEPAVSRAFVEASVAADRIVAEAITRAERLIDYVSDSIAELLGASDVGGVDQWRSRFAGQCRAIITQLRLPNTLAVANLVELLGTVAPSPGRGRMATGTR